MPTMLHNFFIKNIHSFSAFPVERVPFCLLDDDRDVERGFGRFLPQQQHDRCGHSRNFILFASWHSFMGPQLLSCFRNYRDKKRTVADIGAALKVELIGPMTAKSKENRMSEPTWNTTEFLNATVQTTLDGSVPLSEVFFPSVVVCNINQVLHNQVCSPHISPTSH